MKKIVLIFVIGFCFSCRAQQPILEDLSSKSIMNYTFALIHTEKIIRKELYNSTLYIAVFQISDPQATPNNFSQGTHEVVDSYIVSVKSDDTYYSSSDSKLYKIEGIYSPKIIEIKESNYPKFIIKIEHGFYDKRKIETFEFEGVK